MLDYETYCQIRDHLGRQQLSVPQTAAALGLDPRTVAKWRDAPFRPRAACAVQRASKLDPFKGQIVRWLDTHPYSAQQILQRLREIGFDGGRSRPSSSWTSPPASAPRWTGASGAASRWARPGAA